MWRTVDGNRLPVPKRLTETEILGEHQIESCPLYLNYHKEAEILGEYQIEICFLYLMIFLCEAAAFLFPFPSTNFLITSYFFCSSMFKSILLIIPTSSQGGLEYHFYGTFSSVA